MNGYGEAVQYSVFVCDLNDKEVIIMRQDLESILNLAEDRILMINTGQVDKSNECITVMGMSLDTRKEASIVI